MSRYIFGFIILFHALVHLLGFVEGIRPDLISQAGFTITPPAALLWLTAGLVLAASLVCFLARRSWWYIPAAVGLLLSQSLIISEWENAKAGTIVNAVVFISVILAYGKWNFDNGFRKDVKKMLEGQQRTDSSMVTLSMLAGLPQPVQKWLLQSGIVGKQKIWSVHLKQKGAMRMSQEDDTWIPTRAEQYFSIDKPAFVWRVRMRMIPLIPVSGKDRYTEGHGQMLIKVFSLIDLVNESDEKIDQGALQRYLAEIAWFPSAALSPYIRWQPIDAQSARATMTYRGVTGSVIFHFSKTGDITGCFAFRFKGGGKEGTLEKWVVSSKSYATMNGIRMPVKSEATWKLNNGDFTWYKLEITEVHFNEAIAE
jgi:hypothetical protein